MSSKNKRISWTGEKLEIPTKNTKLPRFSNQKIIRESDGKEYRVGATVYIEFDEDLETKA